MDNEELAFFMFYNNKGSVEESGVFFFAIKVNGIILQCLRNK